MTRFLKILVSLLLGTLAVGAEQTTVRLGGLALGMSRTQAVDLPFPFQQSLPRDGWWAPGVPCLTYFLDRESRQDKPVTPVFVVFDSTDRAVIVSGLPLLIGDECLELGAPLERIIEVLGAPDAEEPIFSDLSSLFSENKGHIFELERKELGLTGSDSRSILTERRLIYSKHQLAVNVGCISIGQPLRSATLEANQQRPQLKACP